MIKLDTLTFGSDAEAIILTLTGEPFPVCGLIGGTKDKPRSIGSGYAVQEDNVLLEWNIPVAKTKDQFVSFVANGVIKAQKELPPALQMGTYCAAEYQPAYIQYIPAAQVFGCDPDFNAWTMEQNPRPTCPNPYLRTAAAHVHIGWENPTAEDQLALVKWADVFVGLWSVQHSTDRVRRQLYGRAGAFRPKEYGIEHRVLDNFWVFDKSFTATLYQNYIAAIKAVNAGFVIPDAIGLQVQEAINNYDQSAAQALLNQAKNNHFQV